MRWLFFSLIPFSALAANEHAYEFSFSTNGQGWEGDFCDYPVGEEAFFELAWGWENLPTTIDALDKGLFLSGNNHSDDLFMFVKRRIEGLQPDTQYALLFSVIIESNVPPGHAFGIGGSPGKSVFFKAGASSIEPIKIAHRNYYVLNVDKGNQSQAGENTLVIGDIENTSTDPFDPHFVPKELKNENPLLVKSDHEGRIWIFLGTDSGFEGLTKFYIAKVSLSAFEAK